MKILGPELKGLFIETKVNHLVPYAPQTKPTSRYQQQKGQRPFLCPHKQGCIEVATKNPSGNQEPKQQKHWYQSRQANFGMASHWPSNPATSFHTAIMADSYLMRSDNTHHLTSHRPNYMSTIPACLRSQLAPLQLITWYVYRACMPRSTCASQPMRSQHDIFLDKAKFLFNQLKL